MTDAQYAEPRLIALYDRLNSADHDFRFYERLIGPDPKRVLDLGCGTGLFARRLARAGHAVTGLDLASGMIAWARSREETSAVDWVAETVGDLSEEAVFDVVVMTGHAFQCLLTDAAVGATLTEVRSRLRAGGRFMFESRNPAARAWENWTPEDVTIVEDEVGSSVRVFAELVEARGRTVIFRNHFVFPDDAYQSQSELLFLSQAEIEHHLAAAGFGQFSIYGDWDGGPMTEASREIIVVASPD